MNTTQSTSLTDREIIDEWNKQVSFYCCSDYRSVAATVRHFLSAQSVKVEDEAIWDLASKHGWADKFKTSFHFQPSQLIRFVVDLRSIKEAKQTQQSNLPELPKSSQDGDKTCNFFGKLYEYTADDMREYAHAAIAAQEGKKL